MDIKDTYDRNCIILDGHMDMTFDNKEILANDK